MTLFVRHSVFSSVAVNTLKSIFYGFRYSTLKSLFPGVKPKECFIVFSPVKTCKTSTRTIALDMFASIEENRYEIHTVKNLKRSKCIKHLSKILQCTEEEACNLYQHHDNLAELNINELNKCFEKLQQYGIVNNTIKQNIWIFFSNTRQLSSKLELLRMWKFADLNNAISLMKLPFMKLKKHTLQAKHDLEILGGLNKITYFSTFVKCHEKRAVELFVKYPFLIALNLEALKAILTMTKDVGILSEDLLSDPWLFRYSPQFIENRIHLLDDIEAKEKCKVIKAWMLRCPKSTLNRYFELKDENIAALGSYTNIKDLLSNELDLSDTEVEEMFLKHPPLAKISYSKAKEMVDFLKAEGFSSKMIYQVPRVLCHKQATLLARMIELKKVNPRMMSLQNLCRNKKDYLAFLNKVQGPHS